MMTKMIKGVRQIFLGSLEQLVVGSETKSKVRFLSIEKFMFHIQKTADLWTKLSRQEQKFAKRSIEDMKQHLEQSVLSKFPERYKSHLKQSVISEEDDMGTFFYLNWAHVCVRIWMHIAVYSTFRNQNWMHLSSAEPGNF
ncbi:hypothetical protein L1987_37883 [Smallanthus sonchifolius]|uniref:Uncharacterized protein n=1 Tax=Smallanthus sonchifolius TaxID=185202 RepID=A0ACB9HH59_9ASTR|nr:hypothetical protein L1987_37883 [Smallanthus sonchifolius]